MTMPAKTFLTAAALAAVAMVSLANPANARSAATGPETSNVLHTTFVHGAPRVDMTKACKTGARISVLRLTEQSDWRYAGAGASPASATPAGWSLQVDQARKVADALGSAVGKGTAAKVVLDTTVLTILPTYIWWMKYERTVESTQYDIVCIDKKWVVQPPVKTPKKQSDWFKLVLPSQPVLQIFGTTRAELDRAQKRLEKTLKDPSQKMPQIYHKVW